MNKLSVFGKIKKNMVKSLKPSRLNLAVTPPSEYILEEMNESSTQIEIMEQLEIFQIVDAYMQNIIIPGIGLDPEWLEGCAIKYEIYDLKLEDILYTCKVEAYFQERATARREFVYIFSLIRFVDEVWRVYQSEKMGNSLHLH